MCMFHCPDAFIKGLSGYDEDCFRDPTGTTIMFQIEMKHGNRVNRVRLGAAIDTRAYSLTTTLKSTVTATEKRDAARDSEE